MKGTVEVTCQGCGVKMTLPKCCLYTGMKHGGGWTYKCLDCGGEMREVPKDAA